MFSISYTPKKSIISKFERTVNLPEEFKKALEELKEFLMVENETKVELRKHKEDE